jgi:hypothetical protein
MFDYGCWNSFRDVVIKVTLRTAQHRHETASTVHDELQSTKKHRQRGNTNKVVDGIRAKVLLSKLEDGVRMDEPLLSRETSDGALH